MIFKDIQSKDIPAAHIELIEKFEQELVKHITEILNTENFSHLKVGYEIKAVPPNPSSNIHIGKNNADFAIKRSFTLLDQLKRFIYTQKYIEPVFENLSLIISFNFIPKETANDTSNSEESTKERSKVAKEIIKETAENKTIDYKFIPGNPRHNFDKIVLSPAIKEDICDAIKIIKCKDLIYNEWGFGEVDDIPRSILNFYGEPGTGKTMCAHAIAHSLDKKILEMNYADIESKYVGEAPKNLKAAFDIAKESDSILFFDEADSFLGKRIENVSSAAAQGVNALRSQMLILLEEFPGIVIFATNLVTNFDKAFESRILKHIKFELPCLEARVDIIKKILPSKLPLAAPFTHEQLTAAAEIIEGFSGREIKGAILDLLLSKADIDNSSNIVITYEDFVTTLQKKKENKEKLKAEERKILQEKISKKLEEKAEEKRRERELEEQNNETPKEEATTAEQ